MGTSCHSSSFGIMGNLPSATFYIARHNVPGMRTEANVHGMGYDILTHYQ